VSLFKRRRTCTHPEVSLTPSQDARTALVSCTRCPWRVVAALPPIRRVPTFPPPDTAVLVDTEAFETLRLTPQVEQVFTEWRER
jgi:hypothetical protein